MKKFHSFLILLLLTGTISSQNEVQISFDSYSSELFSYRRGLSQNTVQCVMQDSRGFIWIGTWDGLNRFDGYSFVSYKPDYNKPGGKISNETINALAEDSDGNLWIGTERGLNRYEFLTDTFHTFYYSFYNQNSIPSDSISALCFDNNGLLWIGTNRGLCSYDAVKNVFTSYNHSRYKSSSIPSDIITDLFCDQNNKLWIGTNAGLAWMDLTSGRISRMKSDEGADCKTVVSLAGFNDQLWVGTSCGLKVYEVNTFKLISLPLIEEKLQRLQITAMVKGADGRVWIGTLNDGLFLYVPKTGWVQHFYSDFNTRYGLSNNSILSLFYSKTGELWVGTWHGLNKYSAYTFKFPHYRMMGPSYDYGHNLVWAFAQMPDDKLLVGTEAGLILLDRSTQAFSFFAPTTMSNVPVRSIYIDPKRDIWIGTFQDGLYHLNASGMIIKHYVSGSESEIADNTIWKIVPQGNDYLWLATYRGISRLDIKTGLARNWISPGYESPNQISNNTVNHIMLDRSGVLWASTFDGLNRLEPRSGKVFVFRNDKGNPNSLSNDRVLSSYEDRNGALWIGTMGGGLNRYDRKTGIIKRYGKEEGLNDNVIYDIIEDQKGFLWLTSNKGLIRMNPKDNTFIDYDINDGVQSHEFNLGAACLLDDGSIAVGGMNGFNLFNPATIRFNSQPPPVVITGFEVFNHPYGHYIGHGDTIILDPYNNFFSVSFAALDYSNPSKNQYAYILQNYDKDWTRTDASRRKADYTDVKPGTYLFRVKASNSDGVWNEQGIAFTIIIKPPFYQTWFFRIILIAIIIFITWLFIRGRVNKVRRQNEVDSKMFQIEKQMFDLEQKALRLQMNPHFIFNSLNSIQSFVITNDTENAINYLAKFSQLMRLILTTSRESYISISQEVSLLKYYLDLENMRFNQRFDVEIRVDSSIDTEFTGIPPMIIQPYVENAIIHGLMNKKDGRCNLLIHMWQKEDYILCVVEDNGIGRENAMKIKEKSGLRQKSQGIIITRERLEILNSQLKNKISVEITDIKDAEGNAAGTRVRLVIPYIEM